MSPNLLKSAAASRLLGLGGGGGPISRGAMPFRFGGGMPDISIMAAIMRQKKKKRGQGGVKEVQDGPVDA